MKYRVFPIFLLVAFLAGTALSAQEGTPSGSTNAMDARFRSAAEKAIRLIQASDKVWARKQSCVSCHHQWLPALLFEQSRRRGLNFDEKQARLSIERYSATFHSLDRYLQNTHFLDPPMDPGFSLLAQHAAGLEPTLTSAVQARFLANYQSADGSWTTADARPPQSFGSYASTAMSVRVLQLFLPPQLAEEGRLRIDRARQWLISAKPANTEDRTFRLLGLKWSGAGPHDVSAAAAALIESQQADGGWAQLPGYPSDAYATGQALMALAEGGGVQPESPAYRRGLTSLLSTQQADGSWLVRTRIKDQRVTSPPYFETGFPHRKDQISSIMGTTWAAMALVSALPTQTAPSPRREFVIPEKDKWQTVSLFGSVSELRELLDRGFDPNTANPAGLTVLMMAVKDLGKVRLLLERGAKVNTKSKARYTALIIASLYRGSSDVVRLLLENGAEAQPKPPLPVSAASPLFFAAASGETDKVAMLLERGARVDQEMLVIGFFAATPLAMSIYRGDLDMARFLLKRGANIEDVDSNGMRPLSIAVAMNNAAMVRMLVNSGADLEHKDNFGYTPLLRATATDFGDTAALEALLELGANRNARTPEGMTALDLARRYQHARMVKALAGSDIRASADRTAAR